MGIIGGSNMLDKYYRFVYMNVDLNVVVLNFKVFSILYLNKIVMVVVKVNVYGLGSVKVVCYLMENGVIFFVVVMLDEVIEFRMYGIIVKILVLGVLLVKDIDKVI